MVDLRERDVVRQALDYLAAGHKFAIRLNTGSFYDAGRVFHAHNLGRGVADILVVPPGAVWVECKGPNGRQRPDQKLFQEWVETRWGHKYVLTRSIDDLVGLV